MRFHVMYRHRRDTPAKRQALRYRAAYQERADQAGSCSVGDSVQVAGRHPSIAEYLVNKR